MARRPRIHFPGALYHVISRGTPEGTGVRGMVAYLARRTLEYRLKEIADPFRRSSVTVSDAIRKVEDFVRKDKTFANSLELLTGNLIK